MPFYSNNDSFSSGKFKNIKIGEIVHVKYLLWLHEHVENIRFNPDVQLRFVNAGLMECPFVIQKLFRACDGGDSYDTYEYYNIYHGKFFLFKSGTCFANANDANIVAESLKDSRVFVVTLLEAEENVKTCRGAKWHLS